MIDAVVSETHNLSAEVSEYPTEGGRNLVDHKRIKPLMLNLDGVISDTPLGEALTRQRQQETGGITTPSAWGYERLEQLHRANKPLTITTSLRAYANMVLVDLSITREAATGRALAFTVSAQQIEIVNVARVVVGKPINRGFQNSKPNASQLIGNQAIVVGGTLGNFQGDQIKPLKVYNTGTKQKPILVYADGTPYKPAAGQLTEFGDTPPVVLDKNGGGAAPKRAPDGYYTAPSGRRWPFWN
jgi:hypothetical protein